MKKSKHSLLFLILLLVVLAGGCGGLGGGVGGGGLGALFFAVAQECHHGVKEGDNGDEGIDCDDIPLGFAYDLRDG